MKKQTVGQLIRQRRQSLECSQEAVATAIGVSIKFISYVENGERQMPVEHFPKIAEFLGLSLKELFAAKVTGDKLADNLRRCRNELKGSTDQVKERIKLNRIKEFRNQEIKETMRVLESQRQYYKTHIETFVSEAKKLEKQIKELSQEQELLGFGQMKFKGVE